MKNARFGTKNGHRQWTPHRVFASISQCYENALRPQRASSRKILLAGVRIFCTPTYPMVRWGPLPPRCDGFTHGSASKCLCPPRSCSDHGHFSPFARTRHWLKLLGLAFPSQGGLPYRPFRTRRTLSSPWPNLLLLRSAPKVSVSCQKPVLGSVKIRFSQRLAPFFHPIEAPAACPSLC